MYIVLNTVTPPYIKEIWDKLPLSARYQFAIIEKVYQTSCTPNMYNEDQRILARNQGEDWCEENGMDRTFWAHIFIDWQKTTLS